MFTNKQQQLKQQLSTAEDPPTKAQDFDGG